MPTATSQDTTSRPFFLIGFQRSGTTLLRLMLDSHPDVAIPLDVTGLWDRYERRLDHYGDLTRPSARRALIGDLLAEERIRLWKVPLDIDTVLARWTLPGYPGVIDALCASYAAAKGKRRWGDKDPGNILRIPQVHRWFPDARIVHIVRDGRAACLSHLSQSFGHDDLMECANAWREEVWWSRQMGALLGDELYLEVRFEDLVTDPAAELRRVAAFLELDYTDRMLDYHLRVDDAVPPEKRHIWPLIGEPPRKENATLWRERMSPGTRVCFEKRAGAVLEELGYETTAKPWRGHYGTELRFLLDRVTRAVTRRFRER